MTSAATTPRWIKCDGGRAEAGYAGEASDCFCRAVAIATGLNYQTVYDAINEAAAGERRGRRKRGTSSAREGVYRHTADKVCEKFGGTWVPTMRIGEGCKVHCRREELPSGSLVLNVSKHFSAMIDGVLYDTHDPSRDGTRCVYGYWVFPDRI